MEQEQITKWLENINNELELIRNLKIIQIVCAYPNEEFDESFFKRYAKVKAATFTSWIDDDLENEFWKEDEKFQAMFKEQFAEKK